MNLSGPVGILVHNTTKGGDMSGRAGAGLVAIVGTIGAAGWLAACGPAGRTPPPEEPALAGGSTGTATSPVTGEDDLMHLPPGSVVTPGPTVPGAKPCAGQHTGWWMGLTVEDVIFLQPSCVFDYSGPDACSSHGYYEEPFGPSGSVGVVIETATGGDCLPVGDYECTYTLEGDGLTFDCGAGAFSYARKR